MLEELSPKQLYEGEANVWSLHVAQFGAVRRGALPVWRLSFVALIALARSNPSAEGPSALVLNTTTELLGQTYREVGEQWGEAGHCVAVRAARSFTDPAGQ